MSFRQPVLWPIINVGLPYYHHLLLSVSTTFINLDLDSIACVPQNTKTSIIGGPKNTEALITNADCKDQYPLEVGVSRLADKLENNVFGQQLAVKHILNLIKAHLNNEEPKKALVLSFHGSTGTGKSHTSNLIVESLFKAEFRSPSLVPILASAFEDGDPIRQKTALMDKIRQSVMKCPRSLVLIDDVDHLSEGVLGKFLVVRSPSNILDSLLPLMEFHEIVNNVDYRRTIFILISAMGRKEVNDVTIEKQALPRTELHLKNFEKAITNAAFNSPGGLRKSSLISRGVIDAFIPFLPLARIHIEQCIRDHLRHSGKHFDEGIVFDVASSLQYFHNDFSSTGCKKIASRADARLLEEHDDL